MIIIQLLLNGKNGSTIFSSLESALYGIGFIFSVEMLFLTIFMVVSIAGVVLNTFGVYIFYRPSLNSSTSPVVFSYMKYETMIGVVGNLACIAMGLSFCSGSVWFENTYTAQWIFSYIGTPVYNMSAYAKFLIEIAIVVDRILMLVPSFGSRWGLRDILKVKRPYLILLTVCACTVIINYPFIYLMNSPLVITLVNYGLPDHPVYTYFTSPRNPWSLWGNPGYYLVLFISIVKHVVTFFMEMVLNVISLVLFQKHLASKNKLVGPSVNIRAAQQTRQAGENSRESPGGRKMANLVLFITVTGFVHHLLLLNLLVYSLLNPVVNLTLRIIIFSAFFSSTMRHALNFVQFYLFNTAFRKEARAALAQMNLVHNLPNDPLANNTSMLTR
jgi:hypothetical protein